MNFTVSKNEFSNALQQTARAISPNSPQPSLRGLLLSAKTDTITMTGSDGSISIQKKLTADDSNKLTIVEDGSILIEAKYLLDIVRKIDSEMIQVEIIDGCLTKFSGNSAVFKINGMNVSDYPTIDFSQPGNSVDLTAGVLQEIIDQTTFAASVKETKPVLTGVNFKYADKVLSCTATDSYRLAKKTITLQSEGSFNITIPSRSLNEVKGVILRNPDEPVTIYMNDKKAQFVSSDSVLQTRLLDGGYPETDRLIPKEFKYSLTMNRHDFIKAIDRTTFIKNDNMTVDRLQCAPGEVVLTNKSQEVGESHETLNGVYEGEPLDISFSGTYVMDAAKVLNGDEIIIRFTGEMRPFILTSRNDDTILQLVLPVRTYN